MGQDGQLFRERAVCSPVQDKLPPLASEGSLVRGKTALSSLRGPGLHLMIANQASPTGPKGLERNSLVLFPAPSFLSSPWDVCRLWFSKHKPGPCVPRDPLKTMIWMGRGKSIIAGFWWDARNPVDATVLSNRHRQDS